MNSLPKHKRFAIVVISIYLSFAVVFIGVMLFGGHGFGNAVVNTAEEFKEANTEWVNNKVSPKDSIKVQITEIAKDNSSFKK